MQIIRVSLYQVDIPLDHTFTLSDGSTSSLADVTIVKIVTADELEGWGEVTPLSDGSAPSAPENARASLMQWCKDLLGRSPMLPLDLAELFAEYAGDNRSAWSSIDAALWDILAKRLSAPAYALLNGPARLAVKLDPGSNSRVSLMKLGGITAARGTFDSDEGSVHLGEAAGTSVSLAAIAHLAMATPGAVTMNDHTEINRFRLGGDVTTRVGDQLEVSPAPGIMNEPDLGVLGLPIETFER